MQPDPNLVSTLKVLRWVFLILGAVCGVASFLVFLYVLLKGPAFWTIKNCAPVFFLALAGIVLALFSRQFRRA